MYHLTCPSCQDVTDSHFVRSGAVVRCTACENKFRIKSAHFQRVIHSGPRTLDETDSVLRSDSVDIDPDEIAPVSIDDEGNVVGLSGLSELMRWSDEHAQNDVDHVIQKAKAKRKPSKQADEPLPVAKTASAKRKKKASTQNEPRSARARAQAIKHKKQLKLYIMFGSSAVILIVFLAILTPLLLSNGSEPATDADTTDTTTDQAVATTDPKPTTPTPDPQTTPDTQNPPPQPKPQPTPQPQPTINDDDLLFSDKDKPSPNPATTFVAPWLASSTTQLPQDVPTVLTPAQHLTHEGWYVMTPPRGSADAIGDSNVKLDQLTAIKIDDKTTRLTGLVNNNTDKRVMAGEAHIMLLDSTANVFAETYTPLAMIPPGGHQQICLEIPTRYWTRSRGVRAGVQVSDLQENRPTIQGVQINPVGTGPATALRVSAHHQGDKPLRNIRIVLHAQDADGNVVASYLIKEDNLYIPPNHWLDLVIATPLPPNRQPPAKWSAIVQPE